MSLNIQVLSGSDGCQICVVRGDGTVIARTIKENTNENVKSLMKWIELYKRRRLPL